MIEILKISLFFLVVAISYHCKVEDRGIQDYAWQEESLKMAGEICFKVKKCGLETGAIQGLDSNLVNLVDKRLIEASCKDYHRRTNAYLLKGEDSETIKSNNRNCYKQMLSLECNELVKKKYLEFPSCVALRKIQQFR